MANFFRADPVGSLVKPHALLAAEAACASGALDQNGLEAAQDAAVSQALALQKDIGLTCVTDGELRRQDCDSPYVAAIAGVQRRDDDARKAGGGNVSAWQSPYRVTAGLRQQKRLTEHESRYLQAHTKLPVKIALLAPSALAWRMFEPGVTDAAYRGLSALAVAFGEIIQREIEALSSEGVRYIQLSCPAYAQLYGQSAFEELLEVDIQMLNRINRSVSTALGLHIGRCAATNPSADTFERMLESVLPRAPVDRFLLEYADPQPHDFSSLGALPAGKIAALGLVSTDKDPEEPGELLSRFDQAAARTDERNLAISPRRGFTNDPQRTPEASLALQRRSLQRTTEVVQQIWGLEF